MKTTRNRECSMDELFSSATRRRQYSRTRLTGFLLLVLCSTAAADFQWVPRPDPMHNHQLFDWDRSGERVRLLYESMPDLPQAASGNWTINVYVAELFADGHVENRQLATGRRHFSSLLLQRGGDAVFAVVAPEHGDTDVALETWSAAHGRLISSVSTETLIAPGGTPRPIFPTDDGNFFFVVASTQTARGGRPTTLTWMKMSPDGQVLAKGDWNNPTAVTGVGGGFAVPGGGMGMVLDMHQAEGVDALQTDIEAAQDFKVGGRDIEARVFSETRMLTTDASGNQAWLSPALERDLLWDGDMSIPQDLPMDQMMAQNAEQMALMARVTLENGGNRRIVHRQIDPYVDVQATRAGYGMLAKVAADRSLDPPQHGTWFLEVGRDGALLRQLRIEPAAELLNAKFERFLPTKDDGLLVAGRRDAGGTFMHLTALDKDGAIDWTARLEAKDLQLEGLAGTKAMPWVFGQGYNDEHAKSLLWVERVDPSSAEKVAAPAETTIRPSASSKPATTPNVAVPPGFEPPEPAEGCTCSCEEFASLKELAEKAKSATTPAEATAMVSAPAFQARMNCMAGCAMAYAKCR
jgi:hypothetical protein